MGAPPGAVFFKLYNVTKLYTQADLVWSGAGEIWPKKILSWNSVYGAWMNGENGVFAKAAQSADTRKIGEKAAQFHSARRIFCFHFAAIMGRGVGHPQSYPFGKLFTFLSLRIAPRCEREERRSALPRGDQARRIKMTGAGRPILQIGQLSKENQRFVRKKLCSPSHSEMRFRASAPFEQNRSFYCFG